MTTDRKRTDRRTDALSKERIVATAIEILDAEGEGAQLFRAITARLSTGVGAIYYHVANKDDLLAAAANDVIAWAIAATGDDSDPRDAVRDVALGIFDAIDSHPWVGTQLSRDPEQPAVFRIWIAIGRQLSALGIAGPAQLDAGYALVNYVLGAAAQYAAGPRRLPLEADRKAYLATLATQWAQQSNDQSPFSVDLTAPIREHDDRRQFLAGVDIFLAGIGALGR